MKILLTGVTGYVGGELLKKLEGEKLSLRCLGRSLKKMKRLVRHTTELVNGDILDFDSLEEAMEGVDVAYYLVHSMKAKESFVNLDRKAAINFAKAASKAKVKRIIYLGGLSQTKRLSNHMKSRQEVGALLAEYAKGVEVIEFRASIVIGSGSLSFEMIRALTERLPVMVTPKWVATKAQPIAISDLLIYLTKAKDIPIKGNIIYEIGGKDLVSYRDIMKEYARQRGLHRLMIPVPVLTPYLSSLWLSLVTPLYARVGKKLIESLFCDSIMKDHTAEEIFQVQPVGIKEAIHQALEKEDKEYSDTKWLDAHSTKELREHWGGVLIQGRIFDTRYIDLDCPAEDVFAAVERIGGSNGWYYGDWMWRLRGAIDRLFGGVGMRRGRPHPHHLKEGDIVDFWKVEVIEPGKKLRLQAEMKVPGRAWLEFLVEKEHHKTRLRQTAIYDPLGVLGLAYWYTMYPLHGFVFAGMLRGIAHNAAHQHPNDETYQKKVHLNVSASKAFQWHENPGALQRLIPPWEKVEIVEKSNTLQEGSIVKLKMHFGPFSKLWVARHYHYQPGKLFCDEQISGPFEKWLHKHRFISKTDHSCLLEDIITYRLPFGIGKKWVERQLERMFEYRHRVTAQDLSQWSQRSMKILIAGATGLVGSALRPYLLGMGHEIVILDRHIEEGSIYWDPEVGEIDPEKLEGFDAVINLAGENIAQRWSHSKKKRIVESRVKSTRLLADTLAYLKSPPKVWINASAVGYYGDQGEKTVTEEAHVGSGFLSEVCQKWEDATQAAEKKGIRVVHARFGVVLSPKGGMLRSLLTPFKLGLGGRVGDGKQYMSWIAMDDLLGAIEHILQHEEVTGAVNVVSPHPVTNGAFTKELGQRLHRPTFFTMPSPIAKLIFGSEMAEEMLLGSTRALPKKLEETGYEFHYPKLMEALKHLLP